MSTPVLFGAVVLVLAVGVGLTIFLLQGGSDVHRRLAELNLDAPAPTAGEGKVSIHNLLDDEQKRTLERRLSEAGWYEITPAKMTVYMVGSMGAGAFVAVLLIFALQMFDVKAVFILLGGLIAGFAIPNTALERAIEFRKRSVQRSLPDFLDIVATSVEAGTALSGAITHAMDCVTGPFRDELDLVISDIRLGRSRSEALAAMAQRIREPDLTTTITAIVQAEKLGGNIAQVLAALSSEAREKRMMRAEEIAAQLPVKMVFPMAGFMLPSLILMIFGGLVASYYH